MIMLIHKKQLLRFFAVVAAAVFLLFAGCSLNLAGGSGGETGNPVVVGMLVNPDGKPVGDAVVSALPDQYDPIRGTTGTVIARDTTDVHGIYRFTLRARGYYNVQAVSSSSWARALITHLSVQSDTTYAPTGILSKPGFIKVILPGSVDVVNGYVYIPGTTIAKLLSGNSSFVVLDAVPAGVISAVFYSAIGESGSTAIRYNIRVWSGDTVTVMNPSWKYAQQLCLNTTASGASVAGNVYNFPILVRLTANNFNFSQAKANGEDIRFTKADNTFLPYEIERWDAASQLAEIWVRVDTIYGNDSAQTITMYWENNAAADSSKGAAVFDTAAGFAGVWHLGQPTGTTVLDATANGINGTATATSTVSGAIGAAQSFDGTSSLIQTSVLASDKVNFSDSVTYSVSAWVNTNVLDSLCQAIVFKSNAQWGMQIIPEHDWEFATYIDKTGWEGSRSPATAGSWHALTGVRNGTKQYLYVDGVCADSIVTNTIALPPENVARVYNEPLEIGHCPDGGKNPDRYFTGIIDEVRISRVPLSADWIKLCYMNQKMPDALVKW
ncbi:MAG: DUF2341 domain-containing protein [Chitinispirillaceae bacterium]|jgi:hypothetical protein